METILDILKSAIEKETESYRRYREVAKEATKPEIKTLLHQLAQDERRHVEVLRAQFDLLAESEGISPGEPPLRDETGEEDWIACETELEGVKRAVRLLAEAQRDLEAVQKSKEEFYLMVTHDLRSPLTSLVAFTQKLLTSIKADISGKDHERLEWILNGLKRLEKYVDNFLTLAQLRAEERSFTPELLEPQALVKEVIESVLPQANERKQRFEVHLSGMPQVEGDEWAIRRLFMNLLSNAIRHGGTGGVIEVGGTGEDSMVRFWVRDDGPGIPAKDLPHIFEKYYTEAGEAGSGLGLVIARDVVEGHGGRIWVESKEGKGTTFYFTLPRAKK